MADRWGRVSWPGIVSATGCQYTYTQGTSPQTAVLRCLPQATPFAQAGTLVIYDGEEEVTLNGCKLDKVREIRDGSRVMWELMILDRRWRWRETGAVNLWANQLGPNGKFIPWSVRSLREIAVYALEAMGEKNYSIDLPVGLTMADAAGVRDFLPTGINFPPTGVNPPIDWYYERPAQVLEQLCEMFGRRIVWRWSDDAVWIVRRGDGDDLPTGSISSKSPTVANPQTPGGCQVVGAPSKFQVDLEVQAMAEEYDGRMVPVNNVSYAPRSANGKKHKVSFTGTWTADYHYYIIIDGVRFGSGTSTDMASALAQILAAYNAYPDAAFKAKYTVTIVGNTIVVEATAAGPGFSSAADLIFTGGGAPPAKPPWAVTVLVVGSNGKPGWERSFPPLFPGVRATDRLTLNQARELARKSVWRYYQITGRDVSRKGFMKIPGYGEVKLRQLVTLLDTQCEQVVPEGPDFDVRLKDGTPLVQNYYNGFSRDKPAAAYGAVATKLVSHLMFLANARAGLNTKRNSQIQVDFSIDTVYQTIKFSGPVYKFGKDAGGLIIEEPEITLRCGVNVRDPDTNQYVTLTRSQFFAGRDDAGLTVEKHDDIQLCTIPTYNDAGIAVKVDVLEQDPFQRANYYLGGMINRLQVEGSLLNVYNGIRAIELDGAISQITWDVGDGKGCKTTASRNYEHDLSVPPYPARRRAESLRAAVAPGGFMGQAGTRTDPTKPTPFNVGKP